MTQRINGCPSRFFKELVMRVNARLDDESKQQIDYLTAATGMGVSQVLRESVALYYRQARASACGAKHLLALVGKGQSGRADIASDVKRQVADALSAKHGVPTGAKRAGRRA
jgi:predicted DNA-binding protein